MTKKSGRPAIWTQDKIIAALKADADENGFVGRNASPGGLRNAAIREFGSWRDACAAAGVKAKPRGRPKKT